MLPAHRFARFTKSLSSGDSLDCSDLTARILKQFYYQDMDREFQNLLELYVDLGGVAENICVKEGDLGRGIFPLDPLCASRIMTPRNLLVDRRSIYVSHGEICVKDQGSLSPREKKFLELNYNYAWKGAGSRCASAFLQYVLGIPVSVKNQLLDCGFIDNHLINSCFDENGVLKRFIDERVVGFEGNSVLAPVWDLVNHSSFAQPFRVTPYGVETPPLDPTPDEILHKYHGKNSPMSVWKSYGFACDCIVAYSIPVDIDVGVSGLVVRCDGKFNLDARNQKCFSIVGNILSIKSLPVGCLSTDLPRENFNSILSSVGLSEGVVNQVFSKIYEANLKARKDLVASLDKSTSEMNAQLLKALKYEITLMQNSSVR